MVSRLNTLNHIDKIALGRALILIMIVIAMSWRLPLSPYIRFNFRLIFMWLTILSLSVYIAAEVNFWVGAFLALALVTAHYPHPTKYSGEALLMVILGLVLYLILYKMYHKESFMVALAVFALANVVVVSVQYLNMDFQLRTNPLTGRAAGDIRQGLMDCRNSLSVLLAFCLPVFFGRKHWVWSIGIVAVLIGLLLAKSVGGVIAIIPTLFYYAHKWLAKGMPPWISVVFISSMLICAGLAFTQFIDSPGINGRWAAWSIYGDYSVESPFKGRGLGHWKVVFDRKDIRSEICRKARCNSPDVGLYYAQAHNEVIQARLEMGFMAPVIIFGFLINVLRRARRIIDPRPILILLAIIIDSMVFFPFHIPLLAIVIIMSLVMVEKELRCSQQHVCS